MRIHPPNITSLHKTKTLKNHKTKFFSFSGWPIQYRNGCGMIDRKMVLLKSDSNKYKKFMFSEKTQMTHMWKMTYFQK